MCIAHKEFLQKLSFSKSLDRATAPMLIRDKPHIRTVAGLADRIYRLQLLFLIDILDAR